MTEERDDFAAKLLQIEEQANMALLYAPYVPSLWEDFILRNRRILADQMEFLMAHLPKNSRLHA